MKEINTNLSTFAEGSLQERFDHAMKEVTKNVLDPNTDPSKKRKITITVTLTGDEYRDQLYAAAEVKSTLAPREPVASKILIESDGEKFFANELKSGQKGQMFFDPTDSKLKDDHGTPVEEIEKVEGPSQEDEGNVYSFLNKQTKSN